MKDEVSQKIHDIRNSLNVMKGFMKCIEAGLSSFDDRKLYDACQTSLDKANASLNELQDLIQSRKSHANPE